MAVPIYIPTSSVGGFPFLHTLSNICRLFNDGYSDWYQSDTSDFLEEISRLSHSLDESERRVKKLA